MRKENRTARNRDEHRLPDLLTQQEAVEVLRLDGLGLRNPTESLRYLRRTRQLGYVKVAGKVLIPREEILAYVERRRVRAPN